jgi:hypothetical protein
MKSLGKLLTVTFLKQRAKALLGMRKVSKEKPPQSPVLIVFSPM